MPLDLPTFANKLRRTRDMFAESLDKLSASTGIPTDRLERLEAASQEPSGDEVLILADHYCIDFRFFISNESSLPVDRAEKLFRAYSTHLSCEDRLAIQEFIFLCENEAFLMAELLRPPPLRFSHKPRGTYYKGHGADAARELRSLLDYSSREVPDVFHDLRRLGFHVFRRRLANANISGLFIDHDTAGPCVLVNYNEDPYRQRFTAAHEGAHAIFDAKDEYVVSFEHWDHADLREIRANAFASAFLVPTEIVSSLPDVQWTEDLLLKAAEQLKVNAAVLAIALERDRRITREHAATLMRARVPRATKVDPELPTSMTGKSRARKRALLERGISSHYTDLCVEALQRHLVTKARMGEMLLVDASEVDEIIHLFTGKVAP